MLGHRPKGVVELLACAHLEELKPHSQRSGGQLHAFNRARVGRIIRVREDRHEAELGHGLLEQLEPFADDCEVDAQDDPVTFPPGRAEARHESELHGRGGTQHDDGDSPGGVLGRHGRGRRPRCDNVHLELDELGRKLG
jgi:hypothetical protein